MKREPERIEKLWANTHRMHAGLKELGFDTGQSETPIIAVAPAIANAVHDATGLRVRSLPIAGAALKGVPRTGTV